MFGCSGVRALGSYRVMAFKVLVCYGSRVWGLVIFRYSGIAVVGRQGIMALWYSGAKVWRQYGLRAPRY